MVFIIIILSLLLLGTLVYAFHEHKQARERIEVNREIEEQNADLERTLRELETREQSIKKTMEHDLETLKNIKDATSDTLQSQKNIAQQAFETYCEALDKKYSEKNDEYDEMVSTLNDAYAALQDKIVGEIENQKEELEKIRATRAALIQAQVKEKEIKENKDFYCLIPTENDKDDIRRLERVKKDLHNLRKKLLT